MCVLGFSDADTRVGVSRVYRYTITFESWKNPSPSCKFNYSGFSGFWPIPPLVYSGLAKLVLSLKAFLKNIYRIIKKGVFKNYSNIRNDFDLLEIINKKTILELVLYDKSSTHLKKILKLVGIFSLTELIPSFHAS